MGNVVRVTHNSLCSVSQYNRRGTSGGERMEDHGQDSWKLWEGKLFTGMKTGRGEKGEKDIIPLGGIIRKISIFHILKHQSDAFWDAFFANLGRAGET